MTIFRLFNEGMSDQALSSGNVTDTIEIIKYVKQGCVLASIIFTSMLLSHNVRDIDQGFTFDAFWMALSSTSVDLQPRQRAKRI